ncbi:PDZ domain-containing protein 7-like [Patiria miniata]|uniref:PDZ domain-containing protein n=1 Tax=Patiria miniata TaxID=46514 RepID=A0A914B409_PATMI|nr:PDZ domain-containing protein 7-like [Patiria miniata]
MGRDTNENHRRNLQLFHRKSKVLLNDMERDYLHDVLKQYETYKDVRRLMTYLRDILDTPAKLDLLLEIRGLIPKMHLAQFDWLAPYAKMAHPVILTNADGTTANGSVKHLRKSRSAGSVRGTNGFHDNPATAVRMVTVDKDREALGISIQGGSENGQGIFISEVEPGSVEESLGLGPGDQILEVNNISFDNITSSSAGMVLQGSSRLRLKVKHSGRISGHRISKEKTTWFDTVRRKIVAGEFNDIDPSHAAMGGTRLLSRGDERRVIITLSSRRCIGFNIRGGMEYGVGIYVSKVDKGGLAEAHGITVGDQIIDVNGVTTENSTHAQAVELIRNQPCLIMTIRSVNRYPAYNELCDDYAWPDREDQHKRHHSSSPTSGTTPLTHTELIDAIPVEVAEQYTQTHAHNESNTWAVNQSITMSPTPIPKSSRSSVATETTSLIQKHLPLPSNGQSSQAEPKQPSERTGSPTRSGTQMIMGTTALTTDKRIGRSQSMKFPGEKALPVFESESQSKESRRVQRNRTFREILFGMKMRSKDKKEKAERRGDKKATADQRNIKKRYPSSAMYASLNKKPSIEQQPQAHSDNTNQSETATVNWATRKTNEREAVASSNPGSIARRHRPKPVSTVPPQHAAVMDTQQPTAFTHGAGTQLMYSEVRYASAMSVLEDMAKKLLSDDEQGAIMRHVRWYHQEGRIENLVSPILVILDKPEKVLLLREIRGVVAPSDLGRFDSMVSRKELQAYDQLQFARRDLSQPLNSMRRNSIGKPKKTILETKPDEEGKFFLQTQEDIEQDRRRQHELKELRRENQRKLAAYAEQLADKEEEFPAEDTNSLHNSDIAMSLFENPGKNNFSESDVKAGSPDSNLSSKTSNASPLLTDEEREVVVAVRESTVEKLPVILERHQQGASPDEGLGEAGEKGGKKLGKPKSKQDQPDQDLLPKFVVRDEEEEQEKWVLPRIEDDTLETGDLSPRVAEVYHAEIYGLDGSDNEEVDLPEFEDGSSDSDANSSGGDNPVKPNKSGLYSLIRANGDSGQDTGNNSEATSPAWSSPNPFSPVSDMSLPPTPVSTPGSPPSPTIPKTPPNTVRSPLTPSSNESEARAAVAKAEPIYAKVDFSKKKSRQPVKDTLSVEGSVDGSLDSSDSGRRSPFRVTFTDYRASPVPSRKGILKNSFRKDEAPRVEKRRFSSDYMDIEDINLGDPAPFQEIDAEMKNLKASSTASTNDDNTVEQLQAGIETMTVSFNKNRPSLGISVSGGRDSKNQPEVRIDRIFPGGAASDDGILQAGCEVLSVDGESLQGVTHPQAVDIIRKAYHDKTRKTIEFIIKQPLEMDTHL